VTLCPAPANEGRGPLWLVRASVLRPSMMLYQEGLMAARRAHTAHTER
jgi:hypothetical protein